MRGSWPDDVYLIRHAESLGNVARAEAIAGASESIAVDDDDRQVGLSRRGIEQAHALGTWFQKNPPAAVWSSPYRRARETARLAGESWEPAVPIVVDDRLRERALGILNRLTGAGIRARYPHEALARMRIGKFDYRPPMGESWADVAHRLRGVVDSLHTCAQKRVLIVTHQVVVMCLRYLLERLTVAQLMAIDTKITIANCSVTHYRAGSDGLELVAFNDVAPLAALNAPVTKTSDAADIH